jgi:exopolyphosphatase/guanosine-5'-triphosphate,3'-diphosphate pyrophosphatase
MNRVGAIDIGTNTVLLLIAEGPRQSPVAVLERATITRLGQGVDKTKRLSEEGVARTVACLRTYGNLLREHGADRVLAVCTSAARDAENGTEFLDRASDALGTTPRIVDGDEEARLVFEGALTGLPFDGSVTVFDIGGGSTEVIHGTCSMERTVLERCVSMNIGSVRLTERHVSTDPPIAAELDAIAHDIDAHLSQLPLDEPGVLVGVAGTMTTLAAIDKSLDTYDPAVVHGAVLERSAIERILDRLSRMPLDQRRRVAGLEPARADVIVAGTLIALGLLVRARADRVVVSDRGVRWGLAKTAL